MRVGTTRFGEIDVADELILTFDHGLYGLEEYTRFCLLERDPGTPFKWLQCVDEPGLALVVASPFGFFPHYDIEVDDAEIAEIAEIADTASGRAAMPDVLCVVSVGTNAQSVTMNLRAPVLLFDATRAGRQIILSDPRYATRVPLPAIQKPVRQEDGDARTDP